MQARERHRRHFKSSVGSMLNENYGSGYLPDTVSNEDFLYIPTTSLPLSSSALQFLEHKFPEPPVVKPPRGSTTESLNNAYFKAVGQPHMMVHYDRDPLFRASKKSLEKNLIGISNDSRQRDAILASMEDYGRSGLVPRDVTPASTPQSVSSVTSGAKHSSSSFGVQFRSGSTNSKLKAQVPFSGYNQGRASVSNDRLSRNKHRLWTPGSEAAGFKPYSPFSDSLFDFGKKEAKYTIPEIPEEIEPVSPPRYSDAFQKIMDFGITDAHQRPKDVNVLKVHGNPDYPDRVMADKDIPNYVAWTKIFPYCPLTQVEGKNTPVKVPPRGFTPSTASPSSRTRHESISTVKQKIFAGVQPDQAKGVTNRRSQSLSESPQRSINRNKKGGRKSPSLQGMPVPPPPSLISKLLQHQQKIQEKHAQQPVAASARSQASSHAHSELSGYVDTTVSRRRLAMKASGPEEYYTGHTPSITPTPDHTLPIKPSKAWLKHYSPQRIRHFLAITAEPRVPVG